MTNDPNEHGFMFQEIHKKHKTFTSKCHHQANVEYFSEKPREFILQNEQEKNVAKLHDPNEKPFLSSLSSQDWKRKLARWSANHLPSSPPGRP